MTKIILIILFFLACREPKRWDPENEYIDSSAIDPLFHTDTLTVDTSLSNHATVKINQYDSTIEITFK